MSFGTALGDSGFCVGGRKGGGEPGSVGIHMMMCHWEVLGKQLARL